ncbi:MAG: acetylxylan esterase [Planctomyces sp.]|nr:acetylxylan esterase [Planctomyces sp.]
MTDSNVSRREMLKLSGAAAAVWSMAGASAWANAVSRGVDRPNDARLGDLKDLNGYFPFQPSETPEAWEKRREYVRRQILVASGLWPMPPRPPVNAVVHGKVQRDGYTIERVYFESAPGFLVTGSLYRPDGVEGPLPTILCPHGHWMNGRFHDHGADQLKKELETGGEQFEVTGRHPLQARCVQLARMGCLVFIYDMLGYADGGTLTQDLAHGFAKQRPELSSPERWGLFSAQAELRLLNILGLQTWNSVRILDWLTSLPECDVDRIGVTGASGGGSQTFLLTAIDDRVTAAFPAVMVSTAMQGGCTCENASYLRVNTGNIEFAAMAAPRPIYMTGANDWTVDIETKGLPELKKHFEMLGVPDHVFAKYFNFPHNYNMPSRMMMYRFFNRFLNLGLADDAIVEKDFVPLKREEATVFTDGHPAPPKSVDAEVEFLRAWDQTSNQQLQALVPYDKASLAEFRRIVGGALEVMIGRTLPAAGSIEYEKLTEEDKGTYLMYSSKLRYAQFGEEVPASFLYPKNWNQKVVLWIDGHGRKHLTADGSPIPAVKSLVDAGYSVGCIDLLYTGDFTEDGEPIREYRIVQNNTREFAGYTLGYNHPLFSQRVHDVLSLISFAKSHSEMPTEIHLVGLHGAGPIVAAACAMSKGAVSGCAIDTEEFRFATITNIRDVNLLPGAVKYGDVPALLALCAPTRMAVLGERDMEKSLTTSAYLADGVARNLAFLESHGNDSATRLAQAILQPTK